MNGREAQVSRAERAIVWLGGALFVGSLVLLASWHALRLGRAAPFAGWATIAYDCALFSVFALHHSVLARPAMQTLMRTACPDRLVRAVYVWTASLLLVLVCLLWQPIGGEAYRVAGMWRVAHAGVGLAGLVLILLSVRALDALELAGIRQKHPVRAGVLQISGPYRLVRHPVYLGWMLIVFAPAAMTGDRLVFALISTLYLLVAIPWEERSLEAAFGDTYTRYKLHVRWRAIPLVY